MTDPAAVIREAAQRDRFWLHEELFGEYHEDGTPAAHRDLVADFWSPEERLVLLGFRGFAKSTRAEEYVAIAACERLFRAILFIGPSEARAVDRLSAVTSYLKLCEPLLALYGDQIGEVTTQTRVQLRNGVTILAMGRGQDIRGLKQLQSRPDLIIVDDFEDKENVLTEEGRRQMRRWFLRELRLACSPRAKFRILATLMHQQSVPVQLINVGWPSRVYPVSYLDRKGVERAMWPARFPMTWIERERLEYARLGDRDLWQLEMMCNAEGTEEDRVFRPEMFRVVPRERRWEAVYAMIDPARTTNRRSATTGWAVWSWVRDRLIVWESGAKRLMPDEVVDLVFRINREFDPVEIGVEKDGLDEWVSQPIRDRMRNEGVVLPYRGIGAPRGKIDFIGGLQPFFAEGRCEFVREMPELRDQLLRFPLPPIDAPNALAYAPLMRPGPPIYEGFRDDHIALDLGFSPWRPSWLAVNARDGWTTAGLVQINNEERVHVLADWAYRGGPDSCIAAIATDAAVLASGMRIAPGVRRVGWEALKNPSVEPVMVRTKPIFVAPEWHWDRWVNVGLEQAIRRLPAHPQRGGPLGDGRELLARKFELSRGEPLVQVSDQARWTLRALAGGYARSKTGIETETGVYRCLMEGIESWAALANLQPEDEEVEPNYSYDRNGRRYVSAMPARH